MPLTATEQPGEVDAFGVRFTMEERGRPVRCHIFRAAIDHLEDRPAASNAELLARFQRSRAMFERLASNLFDAGHRTPWIESFGSSD
jgi:hypothetical protein